MKTERRHELQTNKLADWLGHQVEDIAPHGKKILGASILGAVLLIAALVVLKDRQAASAMAWDDFYLALSSRDRDALASVAKSHSGSVVALWAKQAQADLDLTGGIAALYTNRDEAFHSLDDARQGYTDVVNQAGSHPDLMRHSLLGLAQANEATSNLEKARDFYQKVVQQFPGTPAAVEAGSRLEALKDPQVDKWYSWFARQKPKPASSPLGGNLPGLPGDLGKLPDVSDLPDNPSAPLFTPPNAKPATTPAGGETPPAQPSSDVPASDAPAANPGAANPGNADAGAKSTNAPGGEPGSGGAAQPESNPPTKEGDKESGGTDG